MAAVDRLLDAAVLAVKNSGLLERIARMATVQVVNSNGTLDVVRNGDTFPSVRMLGWYPNPQAGDGVLILRGMAGWYCLGRLSASAPVVGSVVDIRSGVTTVTPTNPGGVTTPAFTDVTFPDLEGTSFYAQTTPTTTAPGTAVLGTSVMNVTKNSIRVYLTRTNTVATNVHWTVYGVR